MSVSGNKAISTQAGDSYKTFSHSALVTFSAAMQNEHWYLG